MDALDVAEEKQSQDHGTVILTIFNDILLETALNKSQTKSDSLQKKVEVGCV